MKNNLGYKLADGSYSKEYEVGDTFEVVYVVTEVEYPFNVGDLVDFAEDDNSRYPKFVIKGCDLTTEVWKDYEYLRWSQLKPVKTKEELPFPVGARVELLRDSGVVSRGDPLFLKGTLCTIFGYTKVCGDSIPIIQDSDGYVTTYLEDYLKLPDSLDEKLNATLWNDYNCGDTKGLIKDIKAGKVKGLKYVGEGDE